jgi:rhodanese-related sulfurtransferase
MSLFSDLFGQPVPTVNAKQVHASLNNGHKPFILDVRQPEEFRLGHISGAKMIPLGELNRRLDEVPKGREVVCICATGHRSVPAARKLIAAGYSASSMKNGMIAWQLARFPIQRGK